MDMKTELTSSVAVGEGVCLTFKNGKEIVGVISKYDEELMTVILEDGQKRPVAYSLVGYFEKVKVVLPKTQADTEYEKLAAEVTAGRMPMEKILARLKNESPDLYKKCIDPLNSFRYALKINEADAKYGRSQPVIRGLEAIAGQYPQYRDIMTLLIGSVVAETCEKEFEQEFLAASLSRMRPEDEIGADTIIMLAQLSCSSGCYSPLLKYIGQIKSPAPPLFAALAYILQFNGKKPVFADTSTLYSAENCHALVKLAETIPSDDAIAARLAAEKKPASGEAPVHIDENAQSQAVPFLEPGSSTPAEKGEITYYNPSGRYGFIHSENHGDVRFLLNNVTDKDLRDMLENRQYFKKNTAVVFTVIEYKDRSGIARSGAEQISLVKQGVKPKISYEGADNEMLKANRLFSSGKSNDGEALQLYLSLYAKGVNRDAVANKIVSIYMRSGEPGKAIEFLLENRGCFGEEQYYSWLYQAYMQMEQPEKALDAENHIIRLTSRPTNKIHHLLLKIKYLYNSKRYEEAITTCEEWLAFKDSKKNELQGQAVSLAYNEKQVFAIAAHSIMKVREANSKYAPSQRLLGFLKSSDEAQSILNQESGVSNAGDIVFGDFRNYISPIAQQLLDECVLSECGVDNRKISPGDGRYTGTLYEAKSQAASLVKAITTQKPYVRYRSCLGAARIIYDALNADNNGAAMQDAAMAADMENLFFGYLAKALVSLGDDIIGRHDIDIAVARFYYLESLKYSRVDEQDKQNAITRCVLSVFIDRVYIPMTMKSDRDNLSVQKAVAKHLNETEFLNEERFLFTIVRIINSALPNQKKSIMSQLISAIMNSKHGESLRKRLYGLLAFDADFEKAFDSFHSKYKAAENDFLEFIARLNGITFAPLWLQETLDKLHLFTAFFPYMDDLDQKRCQLIEGLLARAVEYNQFESFGLKENGIRSILSQLNEIEASIQEFPAKYSFECLLNIVTKWKAAAAETLGELYQSKPPEIDCQIIAKEELHLVDDDCVNIQFYISNGSDRQTADSLTVFVAGKEEYTVLTPLESRYYIKEGDGQTIKLKLKMADPSVKAFSIDVIIEYDYRISEYESEHKQKTFEMPVILGNPVFLELENPYSAYVSSGTVDNEKMVFGRSDFIDGVINVLRGDGENPLRRKTIALYGQKRTGKSTVLYHLERRIRDEIKTAVVIGLGDISKWLPQNFERRFYREFFYALSRELSNNHKSLHEEMIRMGIEIPGRDMITDDSTGRELFGDFFREFNALLENNREFSRYNVVVLLDEFTNIYIRLCRNLLDSEFMKYWKAIINDYGLVGIVVGQDYMLDFVNAYPNPFGAIDKRPVTYLPESEARRMITKPPVSDESRRAVFDGLSGERAIRRIIELTAGSAYFIMIFMDRLVKYLNKANQPYVTDADIDRLVADDLLSGHDSMDLAKFESLYYDDGDVGDVSRPRHNVAILWTISKQLHDFKRCKRENIVIPPGIQSCAEMTKERIDDLLAKLVARDVLNIDRNGNYRIKVELFNEWLYYDCSADVINNIRDFK